MTLIFLQAHTRSQKKTTGLFEAPTLSTVVYILCASAFLPVLDSSKGNSQDLPNLLACYSILVVKVEKLNKFNILPLISFLPFVFISFTSFFDSVI